MIGRTTVDVIQTITQCCSFSSRRCISSLIDAFVPPPQIPTRRVVVTGIGLVTPLGVGVQSTWNALIAGHTGVRPLSTDDLPLSHHSSLDYLPSKVVACVPKYQLDSENDPNAKHAAKFSHFASLASAQALLDAAWHPQSPQDQNTTGVAIGAGMSSTEDMTQAGILASTNKLRKLSPFFIPRVLVNMAAGTVSMTHGLRGPNHATSTACATGAHSIGDAFRIIQRGDADVMVAGGAESCIDAVSIGGFCRLKALSTRYNDNPERASRPFDAGRDGFVLGEGAGVLILEELQHAVDRKAPRMYAEIRGYGMSGDAYHVTKPPPDGIGAVLAMERALGSAGISANQVAYVNAHATSTPIGDDIEQRAIGEVLGQWSEHAAVSSTKGATGHLLGAAGAVEAAFTALAVYHRLAPPTLNLEEADPPGVLGNLVRGKAQQIKSSGGGGPIAALSNSFGFGGTNASLCFASIGRME
jgi:3-oxoacyl-[acyl-carrier-protein] synthase II